MNQKNTNICYVLECLNLIVFYIIISYIDNKIVLKTKQNKCSLRKYYFKIMCDGHDENILVVILLYS